ncbi:putative entry exclusion protein TrbK-alt [Bradyrhizobium diazoefficiens]|uniref:putative entry exclusion protein TrbK-alt n=1 Tax=Bradyrhizobium diazoefficiens TaxID=1355477 RepID=UPI00190D8D1C|nr:putative entry exclusion protein TrbK-alt [Bradyrhizobium diazoefficiens]MBK3665025.1 putative entry exclusion protein TrbK-alt [Bradyrhizobium diazoefficiens]
MSDIKAFKALSLAVSIGVFVVAACTIQLRGGEDASLPPRAEQTTDVDHSDLARCRTVTPEETASYQHCQQVWAENRNRFFGRKDGAAASRRLDAVPGPTPAPKDESRMPQGYPSLTPPEVSKP